MNIDSFTHRSELTSEERREHEEADEQEGLHWRGDDDATEASSTATVWLLAVFLFISVGMNVYLGFRHLPGN